MKARWGNPSANPHRADTLKWNNLNNLGLLFSSKFFNPFWTWLNFTKSLTIEYNWEVQIGFLAASDHGSRWASILVGSRFSTLEKLALSCWPTSAPSSVHLIFPAKHSAQRWIKDHGRHTYTATLRSIPVPQSLQPVLPRFPSSSLHLIRPSRTFWILVTSQKSETQKNIKVTFHMTATSDCPW